MRKVRQAGLELKLRKWMKLLKLEGWNIRIRFKSFTSEEEDKDGLTTAAEVEHCSPVERTALINIATNCWTKEGFGVSFNIDTLILHELIHVILWDETDRLPKRIKESKRMEGFEEFICFHFAKLIHDMRKR